MIIQLIRLKCWGEAECTHEQTDEDMENGLGSAIRKLYKGRNGERIYAKYKTKRGKRGGLDES